MAKRLPVLERILQDIKTTAETIAPAAGYTNKAAVKRIRTSGNAPKASETISNQIMLTIALGTAQKLPEASQDKSTWLQQIIVDAYVSNDAAAEEELDARIASAVADTEKALTATEASYTRGGLAFDTELESFIPFRRGQIHGVSMRFLVQYETVWRDPYTSNNQLIDSLE